MTSQQKPQEKKPYEPPKIIWKKQIELFAAACDGQSNHKANPLDPDGLGGSCFIIDS